MIKMKKLTVFLVLALLLVSVTAASASTPSYTEGWDGKRGTDSWNCYVADKNDPRYEFQETGWIHWVFSTKGKSTNASLTLSGTGSGTYAPGNPLKANVWHFYTPYFELEGLTAMISLYGGRPGPGGGLVISDWCPGEYESLDVSKTAVTSFEREHFWKIAKKVVTENKLKLDGYPKIWLYTDGSGDEKATWAVNVSYNNYKDFDFNVSGKITIFNDGQLPAVITAVDDVLAGDPIDVSCGVTFPHTLPVGDTLTCTYNENVISKIEGFNNVTVTTERDEYFADAEIIWGDPTTEINKTVTVEDVSNLFDKKTWTVTAPNSATFTYEKAFKWADYGKDKCGPFIYNNTATIVETGQSASAKLKVNVQCYKFETAFAMGKNAISFCDEGYSRWGWTNPITPGTYEMDLWAGAGQCDTSKGTLVGSVTVVYGGDGYVTVSFNVASPYILDETHVYAGYEMFPEGDLAPGLYKNNGPFDGTQVYVIAHAVVGIPDPNFGP
jgi:hypothetical protein